MIGEVLELFLVLWIVIGLVNALLLDYDELSFRTLGKIWSAMVLGPYYTWKKYRSWRG